MTKNITLKKLRPKLPEIINDIDSRMDRFVITRRGKPVALMMSIDDYESLLETIDMLSNSGLVKRIKAAEMEIKKGHLKPLSKIEKELGLV